MQAGAGAKTLPVGNSSNTLGQARQARENVMQGRNRDVLQSTVSTRKMLASSSWNTTFGKRNGAITGGSAPLPRSSQCATRAHPGEPESASNKPSGRERGMHDQYIQIQTPKFATYPRNPREGLRHPAAEHQAKRFGRQHQRHKSDQRKVDCGIVDE
jgi:hypothetical protein